MSNEPDKAKRPERMRKVKIEPYTGPSGGWGSARSVGEILLREKVLTSSVPTLFRQNKPTGFACVSCAWAKPAHPHPLEFCENGAKATAWEITPKRAGPEFFAEHTVTELEGWSDYELEETGRLTHPMRWDKASDKYLPVSWEEAFAEIGRELKALDPKSTVFYTSGRAALETSYMYGLFARMYGHNNLPDSSNMCHESTSVALPVSIGVPVGTVLLKDFEQTDGIFFFGQNVATSSPRMLHQLQEAVKRGVPIVVFNPLRERGFERFADPQSPTQMLTRSSTRIGSQYHQVKVGGDTAAIMGVCKALIAADDEAKAGNSEPVLDHPFIEEHTHGFEAFAEAVRKARWEALERRSGLTRSAMEATAAVYAKCRAAMGIFGMGLTQHTTGVSNVQMVANLLLLRGNIGKPGAGICPVRGHSNVQGQRTVGITEKPKLAPLDRWAEQYGFEPPRDEGMTTIDACEGIIKGSVEAFVALGGNFVRAAPETNALEDAWRRIRLTVQISTKPNRNHVIHGEIAYVLPCLGRIEEDVQASGPQDVSMEDSTAMFHGSRGRKKPAGEHLLSEPKIVAELAKATLRHNPKVDWDAWVADYARIRESMEATWPDMFRDYSKRMWQPGGFERPIPARERKWATETGKANFVVPEGLTEDIDTDPERRDILQLTTLRSNDQFNTTVYGYHDRFRGVKGTRMVLFMHRNDIDRLGFKEDETVSMRTEAGDGVERVVHGFRVTPYDIPEGCVGAYYPECNPLLPLWHHAKGSKTPSAKSIPVVVLRAEDLARRPVEPPTALAAE